MPCATSIAFPPPLSPPPLAPPTHLQADGRLGGAIAQLALLTAAGAAASVGGDPPALDALLAGSIRQARGALLSGNLPARPAPPCSQEWLSRRARRRRGGRRQRAGTGRWRGGARWRRGGARGRGRTVAGRGRAGDCHGFSIDGRGLCGGSRVGLGQPGGGGRKRQRPTKQARRLALERGAAVGDGGLYGQAGLRQAARRGGGLLDLVNRHHRAGACKGRGGGG